MAWLSPSEARLQDGLHDLGVRPNRRVACEPMFEREEKKQTGRLAGILDLLVDFATLGEYGLEPVAVTAGRCERDGLRAAWEALATSRRGECRDGTCQAARAHA